MIDRVKNTEFDNLVNYQTLYSNSSVTTGYIETSSDPNSLGSIIKNHQIISYNLIETIEKTVKQIDEIK